MSDKFRMKTLSARCSELQNQGDYQNALSVAEQIGELVSHGAEFELMDKFGANLQLVTIGMYASNFEVSRTAAKRMLQTLEKLSASNLQMPPDFHLARAKLYAGSFCIVDGELSEGWRLVGAGYELLNSIQVSESEPVVDVVAASFVPLFFLNLTAGNDVEFGALVIEAATKTAQTILRSSTDNIELLIPAFYLIQRVEELLKLIGENDLALLVTEVIERLESLSPNRG